MTEWTAWPAAAKLNLFLHVTGRRDDGYHELQTVFQLLDLVDTVSIRIRLDGAIQRDGDHADIPESQDLCLRAARLLQQHGGSDLGADIRLEKRIPIGGGLGGGSSDAATVLCVLNKLWGCGLDTEALAALGLRLGADVPVFVRGSSGFAEGVGERLVALDLPEDRWFLVLQPAVSVSTALVFSDPELTRDTPPTTISRFLAGEPTHNDLEPVVRRRFPAVDSALHWLSAHAPARMSGSGSCVFAQFSQRSDADHVATLCPGEWRALVARGINRSPLWRALAASTEVGPDNQFRAGTSPSR